MAARPCGCRSLISLLLFATVALWGCRSGERTSNVDDNRPQVLTTFTVLADLARNVAGDRLLVRSIVKPGAEIHGYQPTPSDIERASTADLIVENGLGLELWAQRFTAADFVECTIKESVVAEGVSAKVWRGEGVGASEGGR